MSLIIFRLKKGEVMKKLMVLGSWFMVFSLPLFAQETFTLTTYYPAPFGVIPAAGNADLGSRGQQ